MVGGVGLVVPNYIKVSVHVLEDIFLVVLGHTTIIYVVYLLNYMHACMYIIIHTILQTYMYNGQVYELSVNTVYM